MIRKIFSAGRQSHFFAFIFFLALSSCAPKQETSQVQLAGNRKMALVLKVIEKGGEVSTDRETINYLLPLLKSAIEETYATNVMYLNLEGGRLLQSPENLYRIASNQIDDLLIASFQLPENFQIPSETKASTELSRRSSEEVELIRESQRVQTLIEIVNGANLRAVVNLQTSTAISSKTEFETNFVEGFRKSAGQAWPNPNLYPKSDPIFFADLLFQFSIEKEKQSEIALSCDKAEEYLGLYGKTAELYQAAREMTSQNVVAQQERIHSLNQRIEESQRKAEILEKCRIDRDLKFAFEIEFENVDKANQEFIRSAVKQSKLGELLEKYTQKPVRLLISSNLNGSIQADIFLRYDSNRYLAWLKQLQIPEVFRGYHVLSFEPYFALMKTLVYMRNLIPTQAPMNLRDSFRQMPMSLHLDTLMNGSITVGVNGRFLPRERSVDLFSPNSLLLSIPNFEAGSVMTRSEEIFQSKAWITLSSCRTIDGTLTEDGLVMRFFGMPCKI